MRLEASRSPGWRRLLLLTEAAILLAGASAAIRLMPFRRLARHMSATGHSEKAPERPESVIAAAARAVDAMSRRLPFRTVCFQRGLALHWMLRRRGIPSVLHYGAALNRADGISAHVWVTVDGRSVIGGEGADRFTCLARFPPSIEGAPQ